MTYHIIQACSSIIISKSQWPWKRVVFTNASQTRDLDNPDQRSSLLVMSFGQFVDHDITHSPILKNGAGNDIDCCRWLFSRVMMIEDGVDGNFDDGNYFTLLYSAPIQLNGWNGFWKLLRTHWCSQQRPLLRRAQVLHEFGEISKL